MTTKPDLKSFVSTPSGSAKPPLSSFQGPKPALSSFLTPKTPPPSDTKKTETPIITGGDSGSPLKNFVGAGKDILVGAGKSAITGARDVAQMFQGAGQRIIAGFSAKSDSSMTPEQKKKSFDDRLAEVKKNTGFQSVNDDSESGSSVKSILEPKSTSEKVGGVLETGAELLSGFASDSAGKKIITEVQQAQDALKAKKEANAVDNALNAVTPSTKNLTPTEYQDLLRQKRITPKTATSPSSYILSDAEKNTALKYKDLLQSGDPVKNSTNIMTEISNQDKQVGEFLGKNNGIYNTGELKNSILGRMKGISDLTVDETRLEKLKNTMVDNFTKSLKKNDMKSLWEARKSYDREIENAFSGSPTLQKTIKTEFRNAIQDFIAERTPEGVYKGYMKDMTNLFNLQDTIAGTASKEKGLNAIQVWMKNNPNVAKIIGWGTGLVGAEQIYTHLKQ